jgi:hypothetical protein
VKPIDSFDVGGGCVVGAFTTTNQQKLNGQQDGRDQNAGK